MDKNNNDNLKPSFSALVLSIASAAVIKMGLEPNVKEEKDLKIAQYNIDLLSILFEKTKNNLNKEETSLISTCIKDLQVQFVKIQNESK